MQPVMKLRITFGLQATCFEKQARASTEKCCKKGTFIISVHNIVLNIEPQSAKKDMNVLFSLSPFPELHGRDLSDSPCRIG